jgi:hypothetical protein
MNRSCRPLNQSRLPALAALVNRNLRPSLDILIFPLSFSIVAADFLAWINSLVFLVSPPSEFDAKDKEINIFVGGCSNVLACLLGSALRPLPQRAPASARLRAARTSLLRCACMPAACRPSARRSPSRPSLTICAVLACPSRAASAHA